MDQSALLEIFKTIGQANTMDKGSDELLSDIGCRLNEGGLPIMRIGVGFPTLHPIFAGFDLSWQRDTGKVERSTWRRTDGDDPSIDYDTIPFAYMGRNEKSELHEDLTGVEPSRFPLVVKMKEDGATGYFATTDRHAPRRKGGPLSVFFSSWATDRPGGFADQDLEIIRSVVPALSTALRALSNYDVAYDLLRTYLGRNAGKKVIEGSVTRGSVEVIDAAILFADLAGFTQAADTQSKEDLADLLNTYFDVLVSTIHEHDGEVLKFIGDGVLAVFPVASDRSVTHLALDASAEILRKADALRSERAKAGKINADMAIALHRGELLYGNVGSEDRLDFTVIGPAVNEASRIQSLCRGQQQRLIVSSSFAESAGDDMDRLVSLGKFALRGVRKPQSLYTLDLDTEMEAMPA